jgi:CelD/BcsL family acetyltransferase involved in cellulose biosynthesis/ribosomal protein S18 acetylase RimI-like enzyme
MPRFRDKSPVSVEEINSSQALEAVRPQWQALWRADRAATPFQSPSWLIPWWNHIGTGELCALAVRAAIGSSAGRLVGFVPLYIYTQPGSGSRDVFPLGVATTDYLDGIFAPGWADCSAAAVLAHLDRCRDRWDVLDLQQLRAGSPLLTVPRPSGWIEQTSCGEPCLVLPLPASATELPACIPPRLLHNLHYYRDRGARQGDLSFECADRSNLAELFEAQLALHRARWSTRGEKGVLDSEEVQAAHRMAMPQLLADGSLRLYALRLDGRIIATLYALSDDRSRSNPRVYYYLGGMDPAFEKLSPGTLLIGHAIEQAIDQGAGAFDFLRGQEQYKYLWGGHDVPMHVRRMRHAPTRAATVSAPRALPPSPRAIDSFELRLETVIRPCRREDLPALEWFGLFEHERTLIHRVFDQHQAGRAIMLVAEVNGVASGQVWIDLSRKTDGIGFIWAARVFPTLQRKGLGTRLIQAAEEMLRQQDVHTAEITVRMQNAGARRLYERLGYRLVDEQDELILRKALDPEPSPRSSPARQPQKLCKTAMEE